MKKYSFKNDYSEGAHPNLLNALNDTNFIQTEGYSTDIFCLEASKILKNKIGKDDIDIHFVSGGTQANLIMISSALRPYESVISATTGHINIHEAGAIESTGHKINSIDTSAGKLTPELVEEILKFHTDEHMVKPKLVYISNSTEVGTIYKKHDLEALFEICRKYDLYLVMDGARLGSALTSPFNDLSLNDIANLCDMFYIGGTKNGALIGEAIIITNSKLKDDFRYHIKQKGGLIAKGRIFGIQFIELFKENLYFDLANHSNRMALKLAEGIKQLGFSFLYPPESNQIFPIFPKRLIDILLESFDFYIWKVIDEEHYAVRLVTSWATKENKIDEFLSIIQSFA
ncbi:aminotransferase class V-fold PLP-dependent enzyme [Deferribacter autotrophicus]|uniref:Aminotransferase class V-fold PLP-dependent enzyme n=1 Tax=Deferribacter autotrophicus TaxID=500465 RepID=A0A5A8F1W9_9BACT|nr:aminotransferase class V-fold PLP-dependent enzyme [Deferribacter autotrophicus]KAA0257305.1 aminotransferase class V-fold PLP-dependent enzyme [Deferribacter autotrophicus]